MVWLARRDLAVLLGLKVYREILAYLESRAPREHQVPQEHRAWTVWMVMWVLPDLQDLLGPWDLKGLRELTVMMVHLVQGALLAPAALQALKVNLVMVIRDQLVLADLVALAEHADRADRAGLAAQADLSVRQVAAVVAVMIAAEPPALQNGLP